MEIKMSTYRLKELTPLDFLDVFEYSKKENGYMGPFLNSDEVKKYIINYYDTLDFRLPKSYAILNKQGSVIGQIDNHTYIEPNGLAIGFILREDYRGHGVMQKALKCVIKDIFLNTSFKKIYVSHELDNIASQKVILACDFRFIAKSILDGKVIYNYCIEKIDYERGMLKWQ